jgi:DMSO reductase anchor subunit
MHPAYSVIFFTSASGAGYALLAVLSAMGMLGVVPPERWFGLAGFLVGLLAVSAGLLSSTFHLGRPERAWRAFSQWRSSWLSREGVLAVVTFIPAGLTALGWVFLEQIWWIPGLLLAFLAITTLSATAMIYASLKTVRRWRNGWTLPGYLTMGFASGSLWFCLLCACFGAATIVPFVLAFVCLAAAGLVKLGYWRFVDTETGIATAGSATGLDRFGKVKLFAAPHTEENYLLKEMGFKIARKHAVKLRGIAFLTAFMVPALAILLAWYLPAILLPMLLLGVVANAIGTLTERWLFFAEARHVVTLYYGADAA